MTKYAITETTKDDIIELDRGSTVRQLALRESNLNSLAIIGLAPIPAWSQPKTLGSRRKRPFVHLRKIGLVGHTPGDEEYLAIPFLGLSLQ